MSDRHSDLGPEFGPEPAVGRSARRDVYTVSRLNQAARALLEDGFPSLWVEAELSNLSRPSSGHWYFSLKDARAQVRCAMFRARNRLVKFTTKDGVQVLVHGRLSLYEPRGDYQLIVEHMEEAGDGALRRAFEELKARLATEGLFDEQSKKPLPVLPHQIGVITSPSGAAIRDILTILRRRFPAIPVIVYPVPVQGKDAAPQITRMLAIAARRAECDVLIVARGGGSLEDLWAFNEEAVARAIHACPIPVISGIGHEIDFTIADFAADRRAPTPSGAAELVSPDQDDWFTTLARLEGRLGIQVRQRIRHAGERLDWIAKRLSQQHPGSRLRQRSQRLDELEQRLQRAMRSLLRQRRARLAELTAHVQRYLPLQRLAHVALRLENVHQRLYAAIRLGITRRRQQLTATSRAMEAVSPLATLARGYAIVRGARGGPVLRDARTVLPGTEVEARLSHGTLLCEVTGMREE